MARKQTTTKKEKINIEELYKKVNPYLRDGFKRYIFENNIEIKDEKQFNEILEKYGGF